MSQLQKEAAFLLTEIALDLLSNQFFDLHGNQVKDLEALYKLNLDENDYVLNSKKLSNLLEVGENGCEVSSSSPECDEIIEENVPTVIDPEISNNDENCANLSDDNDCIINETESHKSIQTENNINEDSQASGCTDSDNNDDKDFYVYQTEPDSLLLRSKLQDDRIQYLIESTKFELNKIIIKSKISKRDYIKEAAEYFETKNKTLNLNEVEINFRQKERKDLENEGEQLISLIKIIKKSEFPLDNKELCSILDRISGDIMKAKSKICSDPTVCISTE